MKALEIGNVKITSGFWKEYQELILKKVIPYQWDILNDVAKDAVPDHSIENFSVAEGNDEGYPSHCIQTLRSLQEEKKAIFTEWFFRTVMWQNGSRELPIHWPLNRIRNLKREPMRSLKLLKRHSSRMVI